jgi:phenylacetic acid degradation operon negative regulatory protein
MGNVLSDGMTANELVLDLLSGHETHELPVAALCRAASIMGIGEQTLRVALTRLVQQGKITARSRAVYTWNPGGHGLFQDVRNWLYKERQMAPWTGGWIGVLDSDMTRTDRATLRGHFKALELRGFKLLRNDLSLRPDNIEGGVQQVREELIALGLSPIATVIGVTSLTSEDERHAKGLWDIQSLDRSYSECLHRLEASLQATPSMSLEQAAAHTLIEGRRIIREIILDPLLPDEMFDSAKRHQLIENMTAYQGQARAIWLEALAL